MLNFTRKCFAGKLQEYLRYFLFIFTNGWFDEKKDMINLRNFVESVTRANYFVTYCTAGVFK